MKRAWRALLLIVGLMTARAADAATTYHFSPDLAREGNGLMLALSGHHWAGIIGINVAGVLLVSLCTLYWGCVPLTYSPPPQREPDVWGFASYNLFGRLYPRRICLWLASGKLPKNWRLFCQFFGVVAPLTMIAASLLAVFSWFALAGWHWTLYRELYRRSHTLFPYALLAPFYAAATGWFFRGEWRRFQAAQSR